jgi:Domain of unknown function (DUF4331)
MTVRSTVFQVMLALSIAVAAYSPFSVAWAADHRDAPGVDGRGEGDITDVFAFRDPNRPDRIVLAMGVNPFAVAGLPNSYRFSQEYLYQFKVDVDGDNIEDFVVQFTFEDSPSGQIVHEFHGVPAAGFTGAVNQIIQDPFGINGGALNTVLGDPNDTQVWCGLADDPFVVDVSQFFRIVQSKTQDVFRDIPTSPIGHLRGRPVVNGRSGIDTFAGFNASFLVVSFPADFVRPTSGSIIKIWGTVSEPVGDSFVQFERMGQPLFNTVFIPAPMKDDFNTGIPQDDVARWSMFVPDALTTTDNDGKGNTIAGRRAVLTQLGLHQPPFGAPLLLPEGFGNTSKDLLRIALVPDVLRLDLNRDPKELAVGAFGLSNGRRYEDWVVNIALRVLRELADVNFPAALGIPGSGSVRPGALNFLPPDNADPRVTAVLQGTDFTKADSELGDITTSGNDRPFRTEFPYLPLAHPRPGDQ